MTANHKFFRLQIYVRNGKMRNKKRKNAAAAVRYNACPLRILITNHAYTIFITSTQQFIEVFKFYKLWHVGRCTHIAFVCIRIGLSVSLFIIADFSCDYCFFFIFFGISSFFVFTLHMFYFHLHITSVLNLIPFNVLCMLCIAFGTPFNRVHITLSL